MPPIGRVLVVGSRYTRPLGQNLTADLTADTV